MSIGTLPYGVAAVNGKEITVDQWSKRPEVIAARVADITQKNYVAGGIFSMSPITTGSVVAEIPDTVDNDTLPTVNPQRVAPLSKAPKADLVRGTLQTFEPEKWTLEYDLSYEAIEDNDESQKDKAPRVLANGLTRTLNVRALELLEAAATTYSRTVNAAATWDAINALTADTVTNISSPLNVFALAEKKLELEERDYDATFDTLILHPNQKYALSLGLGDGWKAKLKDTFGITNVMSSARITSGTAYYLKGGAPGSFRFNRPLTIKPREDEEIEARVLKANTRFIPYVNDPWPFLKLTNLGA